MKKFLVIAFIFFATASYAADPMKIKVGVTSGPHEEVMEFVKTVAAGKGLEIEIIPFSDFVLPNAALADGDLDANSIQHLPYLQNAISNRGYKLVPIATNILLPMAIYSKKVKNVGEIQDGATVTIPNDPSNGGRALLLLASCGLIELDPAAGILPTVIDITKNERGLKFVELDAAQLLRALDGSDMAVVNTNYAVEAGLLPSRDALFVESKDSPYMNIIVVREGEEDRPEFKILLESYINDEVKKFIDERFEGAIIPGW